MPPFALARNEKTHWKRRRLLRHFGSRCASAKRDLVEVSAEAGDEVETERWSLALRAEDTETKGDIEFAETAAAAMFGTE